MLPTGFPARDLEKKRSMRTVVRPSTPFHDDNNNNYYNMIMLYDHVDVNDCVKVDCIIYILVVLR